MPKFDSGLIPGVRVWVNSKTVSFLHPVHLQNLSKFETLSTFFSWCYIKSFLISYSDLDTTCLDFSQEWLDMSRELKVGVDTGRELNQDHCSGPGTQKRPCRNGNWVWQKTNKIQGTLTQGSLECYRIDLKLRRNRVDSQSDSSLYFYWGFC